MRMHYFAALIAVGALACTDAPSAPLTAPLSDATVANLALLGPGSSAAPISSRRYPDMCLDVPGSAYRNGTAIETWSCHSGANQVFLWKSSGEIVPSASQSFCLDASGGQGRVNDPVILWSCTGGANQKWSATSAGEIKGINGLCVDLVTNTRANGTRLVLHTCNGYKRQKWDNGTGPGPTPPPPPPPTGIAVFPGQSIQAAVNANPSGTTFILKAGTHVRQSVIPKSGNSFIGEVGTVLDGQNSAKYAFGRGGPPYPSNVTIKGLKITGYVPNTQSGTIDAGGYYPNEGSDGWVIDDNEVSYNGEYGIRIGNNTRITNNRVHHNLRLNVAGSGNGTLIANNEIAFGNYQSKFSTNFEAGGTKFAYSDGVTVRGNNVHDNMGVGIHFDENNIRTVIEGNTIHHNGSEGIAIEISYATVIRNNTVTDNGWFDPRDRYTYVWNAGIGVHASPDVEVYGNTVTGNYAGIVGIEQDRSMDAAKYGPHILKNFYVHDNTVTQTNRPRNPNELSVAAGIVTDIPGNLAPFTSRNNRFVNNDYTVNPNPQPFAWMNGTRTIAQWKGYGHDQSGTFR
jgi:parallel beta-helix repeat protein